MVFSLITNRCKGQNDNWEDPNHAEVFETGRNVQAQIQHLVSLFVAKLDLKKYPRTKGYTYFAQQKKSSRKKDIAIVARKPFIGGNWKSNGSRKSVEALVKALNLVAMPNGVDVCVSPTNLHLDYVYRSLKQNYLVAAQDCSSFKNGAHTGKVSAEQLSNFRIRWVIIGHSETRHEGPPKLFAKKVDLAMEQGLNVILCVGETLEQRKKNKVMPTIISQLQPIADNNPNWSRIVIAYEPIWAIGTGVTASPGEAQKVHDHIRQWLNSTVSSTVSNSTRIIYGGSVKPKNCDSLYSMTDIDGFLVGGASLKPKDFEAICYAPLRQRQTKAKL